MKQTYEEAIAKVFEDEGSYTNDPDDPGGPTNWGITLEDARMYWNADATATDVAHMPKSVAENIYAKHYAIPLHYDDLPAGVDYAVLDFGINSGIGRSIRYLQKLTNTEVDSYLGPVTIAAAKARDPHQLINAIYDARLAFLQQTGIWWKYHNGWTRRCTEGRALALSMVDKYKQQEEVKWSPVPSAPTPEAGSAPSTIFSKIMSLLFGLVGKLRLSRPAA